MSAGDGRILGTTKIVDSGDPARRWNVVILAEGYRESELPTFAADASAFAAHMLAASPFTAFTNRINVYRVDVASTESGADIPSAAGPGTYVRTYFDATYGAHGLDRLLVVDSGAAERVGLDAVRPGHSEAILVLVNAPTHGGSGGPPVAVFARAPGWMDTALHELGHLAFRLADEYPYWEGCGKDTNRDIHPYVALSEVNVTTDPVPGRLKWRRLATPSVALPTMVNPDPRTCDLRPSMVAPGTVGMFEGARYYHSGVFRPEHECRMREVNHPFCAICAAAIRQTLEAYPP